MSHFREYCVYILANKSRMLYTGVTNDLARRVLEHKNKLNPGFTAKYKLSQLVYYEMTDDVWAALEREKQIKGWLRKKKVALIESVNPYWKDLSKEIVEDPDREEPSVASVEPVSPLSP